ncbi:hypothetical protein D3C84_1099120 [compost metagenome]
MIIDAYLCLAAVLLVGLVIAFGGDYERSRTQPSTPSCPTASISHDCFLPPLGGWPVMLP